MHDADEGSLIFGQTMVIWSFNRRFWYGLTVSVRNADSHSLSTKLLFVPTQTQISVFADHFGAQFLGINRQFYIGNWVQIVLPSQWQRHLLRILSRHNSTSRYHTPNHHSPTSFHSFSTIAIPRSEYNSNNKIKSPSTDESYVLDELSDLLPIQRKQPPIRNLYAVCSQNQQPEIRAADEFLAPEEKLRGIFLQKIRGKTAIEHALTNVGVDLSVDVFAKVVNRGNLSGEAMVLFFNWVIKQPNIPKDIVSYNIIVKALGRRKFFKYMVDILQDMNVQGITPNSETLMIAMDSFVCARQLSKAIQLFEKLEEIGSKCDTESLNVLLQCLCRRSHVGSANSVLNSMKGKIQFNITTYNVVIGGWSNIGSVGEIERMLEAMVLDGFNPDCVTFSHLLEGLGRAGRIEDAVKIFDSMKEEKGCTLDTSNYNAMICNFISIKDFDECLKYYECMLKSNLEPNMDTYTKLIAAFLKARRVADALEMLDEMLSRGIVPTIGTITSFIEPLCSYGPPHAAMMIYKKARKVGCRISLSAYKLLLMRLSRFGKCGMILSIWDEMQESGFSADIEVYEYVINGLCNIGQLENAVIVMEESLRKGFCPSRLIYSKLINKLLASNKAETAYRLFLKIKRARLAENARKFWRANGWHF